MTAPTMEQMLDELLQEAVRSWNSGEIGGLQSAIGALLARFAELERERDEARAAAEKEFGNVMALSAECEAYRADAERLDWIDAQCAQGSAPAIVNDDDGRWAYCTSGMSPVPEDGGFKETVLISSFADPEDWRPSIREAIDAAIAQRAGETG